MHANKKQYGLSFTPCLGVHLRLDKIIIIRDGVH